MLDDPKNAMPIRYVHTLLFDCPNCNRPVAFAIVSDEQNFESTDAKKYHVQCHHCLKETEFVGVMAKRHWVVDWSTSQRPAATAG